MTDQVPVLDPSEVESEFARLTKNMKIFVVDKPTSVVARGWKWLRSAVSRIRHRLVVTVSDVVARIRNRYERFADKHPRLNHYMWLSLVCFAAIVGYGLALALAMFVFVVALTGLLLLFGMA